MTIEPEDQKDFLAILIGQRNDAMTDAAATAARAARYARENEALKQRVAELEETLRINEEAGAS